MAALDQKETELVCNVHVLNSLSLFLSFFFSLSLSRPLFLSLREKMVLMVEVVNQDHVADQ